MKRILLALAAAAAMLVSCNEPAPDHIDLLYFTQFGFTAEANPDILMTDVMNMYQVENAQIRVMLPSDISEEALKKLVPSFSVNLPQASVTVNGANVESGKTVIDFSKPVDFLISSGDNNKICTVSIMISQPVQWTLMASSQNDTLKDEPVLQINPVDNVPYIMGTFKENEFPVLYKVSANGFEYVNNKKFITDNMAKTYGFNFSEDGIPYVTFKDYARTEYGQSVAKISNGETEFIGDTCALYYGTGVPAVFVFSPKNVFVAIQHDNKKEASITRRTLNLAHFDGSVWTQGNAIEGRDASDYAFLTIGKEIDGINYLLVSNQNTTPNSLSLYSYSKTENKWNTVFERLAIKKMNSTENSEKLHQSCIDFNIDKSGNPIILVAAQYVLDDFNPAVIKYDVNTKEQQILGGVMTNIILTAREGHSFTFGLDNFDTPYIAYRNFDQDDKLSVIHLDVKSKSWTDAMVVSTQGVKDNTAPIIRYDNNGIGYIAMISESGVYELYAAK